MTPFRLDGLALGAFLALIVRQPGGLERLLQALPKVVVVAGAFLVLTFVWTRSCTEPRAGPGAARQGITDPGVAGLPAGMGPRRAERSFTSRLFSSRLMVLLAPTATASTSIITSSPTTSSPIAPISSWRAGSVRTEPRWRCRPTLGVVDSLGLAYLSYEFFEKRFLGLKRFFAPA